MDRAGKRASLARENQGIGREGKGSKGGPRTSWWAKGDLTKKRQNCQKRKIVDVEYQPFRCY